MKKAPVGLGSRVGFGDDRAVGRAAVLMATGAESMITQTVDNLLQDHVTLDIDCIDRLYLNAYQPRLQTGAGVVSFFKQRRGA